MRIQDVFDLAFTRDEPEPQEEGWDALKGKIVVGDHAETFLAPLRPWLRPDYEQHWIEAADRLLRGADRTAFITVAFQFWWPMWREGEEVVIQEQLLWANPVARSFNPANPYAAIGDRVSVAEDGHPVSEWRLDLADIEDFVGRRRAAYLPA